MQNLLTLMRGSEEMRLTAFYIILNLHHNSYMKLAKTYSYNQYFNLWWFSVYVLRILKTKKQFLTENKDNIAKIMKS